MPARLMQQSNRSRCPHHQQFLTVTFGVFASELREQGEID
jgi:hypothetical protein